MEFSNFVITAKGQALMAKLMQGTGTCTFTGIKLSSQAYTENQLAGLTALGSVKQSAPITRRTVVNNTSIKIEGAVDNRELTTGYNIQTIGIYANDPDSGEILYAVARATTAGYMPPYNGITVSGCHFNFVVTVGNAQNVTITVDPAGYASIGDIQELQAEIADVKGYVGYNDEDVYGVEVDFTNKKFTRLAGAIGRNSGAGFDTIPAFGGRKRCILNDAGKVLAYHGEPGYSETGVLTVAVDLNPEGAETPDPTLQFPVGTKVQVMVEQPKFYYKVVPLVLDKVEGGKGFHLRKARYYISMTAKTGFKLHPAFIHDGLEKDFVYLSAFEGSMYDTSASAYILDDGATADYAVDLLCSIANAKPASGLTNNLTRRNCGKLAENRGTGWFQSYGQLVAATQLLYLVEYASFNMQNASGLGAGVTNKTDDGETSMTENTGATTSLGNASGSVTNVNGFNVVSYRGEENFYGNIWKWVDGLNIDANSIHDLYVADHGFTENAKVAPYTNAGITLAKENGYVNAMCYNEPFDWLFFPSEVNNGGNSSVPVGDYFYQNNTANAVLTARLGGGWDGGGYAGGFCWRVGNGPSGRGRDVGGRLAYVPGVVPAES